MKQILPRPSHLPVQELHDGYVPKDDEISLTGAGQECKPGSFYFISPWLMTKNRLRGICREIYSFTLVLNPAWCELYLPAPQQKLNNLMMSVPHGR